MILKTIEDANNKVLLVKDNNEVVESYAFAEAIDFSKLMKFLISKELEEKITFKNEISESNEQTRTLISIIEEIVHQYNDGVDELTDFKKSQQNE